MKRLLLYSATLALLCSCSIIGPAFTGLTPGTAAVSAGPNKQIGRRYTPAQDPATGLYGYINDFGMWVIAPKYDYVQAFGSSGMARVKVGNRYGAIDPTGQLVIPLVFSSGSNATAAIQSIEKGRLPGLELWHEQDPATGLFGYLDHYGRWAVAPKFRSCSSFNQRKLAIVQLENGMWGAIDLNGTMVIQPRFNNASDARSAVQRLSSY